MSQLLHLGEVISRNAKLSPNKLGARDLARSLTFRQWNERSCRLGNALLGLGLSKGDRVAVLAYNCVGTSEVKLDPPSASVRAPCSGSKLFRE